MSGPNGSWKARRPFGAVSNGVGGVRYQRRGGAFSGRFFRGDIVIGGGGDVMSSISGSHFIRLMEGLDRSLFVPVRECVCVCLSFH